MIKLFAPPILNLGPFITFDSDIVCIRPFNEQTFVHDGKLVSRWEHRRYHSWWENAMSTTGIWTDLAPQGLSVTPNVMHSDLCKKISEYYLLRHRDALSELYKFTVNHPYFKVYESERSGLSWSEYSLYTIVAEWFGMLYDYHLTPDEVLALGIQLHSTARSVWRGQAAERLSHKGADPGYFAIVQKLGRRTNEEIAQRLDISFT